MACVDVRDAVKVILRFLGFIVNGAVLCQAGWILSHPNTGDLTGFCSWLGQGVLFGFVGVIGMILEFWTFFQFSTKGLPFLKMVARRTSLGGYYFWLGCCALGGMRASVATARTLDNHTWQVADSTIGIEFLEVSIGFLAWTAATLNLLTSCCLGEVATEEEDEEKACLLKKKVPTASPSSYEQDPFLLHNGIFQSQASFASAETPSQVWSSCDIENKSLSAPLIDSKSDSYIAAPEGGWNTGIGSKPFGSM
jgi:hypothetical protein|mmetsp:Transcript_25922/g.41640  ORF Transcript_25922/g.41640 Transcript_25922/m.41640 type:complete len:252 (+) Transcript_25922:100-855(+)|eukprot:CAMPEP_0169125852 /NCGR_PEP_ID=MMETSP1015-20121227/35117_1 /TAXON_ID=342587 /ORGANISM="Karlodinium micrum, Strain CCMP2283" /LENGTH=251 /DNA_ID=CAMNT_0009189439 /DNA_START=95 /DNA_END=850 /DNA_ORIENTATION=+